MYSQQEKQLFKRKCVFFKETIVCTEIRKGLTHYCLNKQTKNTTTNYTIHAKCMIYCQGQAETKCLHVYYKYTKHCTEKKDVQIYYSQQYLSRGSFFTMIATIGNFQERLKINK